MSDLGFDPRPYCERLALAMPERFTNAIATVLTAHSKYENVWQIVDSTRPNLPVRLELDWTLWAFFGPLADERNLRTVAWRIEYHHAETILESIIAAVVESFESEAKA